MQLEADPFAPITRRFWPLDDDEDIIDSGNGAVQPSLYAVCGRCARASQLWLA
jgi:hypothetical protein